MINDGITNKIKFAAPGQEIKFRENTDSLVYDKIRKITWGRVIEMLISRGIIIKKGDMLTKNMLGIGMRNEDDIELDFDNVVRIEDEKELTKIDIENPEERKRFIGIILAREIETSTMLRQRAHDYSDILEPLVDTAFESTKKLSQKRDLNESSDEELDIYRSLIENLAKTLIDNGVKIKGSQANVVCEVTYKEDKRIIGLNQILDGWSSAIIWALRGFKS